jgi:tetratricopeptide (TPR) repeat protein
MISFYNNLRTILVVALLLLMLPLIPACDSPTKHIELGDSYFKSGQWDNAIAEYEKAIKLDSRQATVYHKKGLAYGNKGQIDLAMVDYTSAIELAPTLIVL